MLDRPLAEVGGKGLFVKELEVAIDEGRADLAVHSMKDVPMVIAPQFALATFGAARRSAAMPSARRATPRPGDACRGRVVGTSSLRRESQLRARYPKLRSAPLRGNVNTRLAKLDAGEYDAIILAVRGAEAPGVRRRMRATLPQRAAIPAIGQGILAVEYSPRALDIAALLAPFEDAAAASRRAPSARWASWSRAAATFRWAASRALKGDRLRIDGFIGLPDGTRMVRDHRRGRGAATRESRSARALGEQLLAAGGREILDFLARMPA